MKILVCGGRNFTNKKRPDYFIGGDNGRFYHQLRLAFLG
jgi:hypothetical protein